MIEKTVLDFLTAQLGSVPVVTEVPEDPPTKFVLIEKTGSSRNDWLSCSTFAFQSRAGSLYEAAALNESVKAAADLLPACSEVTAARLNSDYNFTDTGTKHYRYQAVYDIYHY